MQKKEIFVKDSKKSCFTSCKAAFKARDL